MKLQAIAQSSPITTFFTTLIRQEAFYKGSSSNLFKTVLALYAHGINESDPIRRTVDLLFHYFCDIGTVKDVNDDGTIEYYGTPDTSKLSQEMRTRILEIAKMVIAEEINATWVASILCMMLTR